MPWRIDRSEDAKFSIEANPRKTKALADLIKISKKLDDIRDSPKFGKTTRGYPAFYIHGWVINASLMSLHTFAQYFHFQYRKLHNASIFKAVYSGSLFYFCRF